MLMPQLYPDSMRTLQLISSRRWMDRQIYFPSTGPFPHYHHHQKVSAHTSGERQLRVAICDPGRKKGGWRAASGGRNVGDLPQSCWQVFSQPKPVLLIRFDVSLITFIYLTSATSRRLGCISIGGGGSGGGGQELVGGRRGCVSVRYKLSDVTGLHMVPSPKK